MKKQLFLLGLAVAAMSSCTNDEVLEMQSTQKAIGFDSFVNKATRAITGTDGELSQIYVEGYYGNNKPVFTNLTVTKGTEGWTYAESAKKYWTANTYYFAAYAQGNNAASPTGVSFSKPNDGSHGTLSITDYAIDYVTDAAATVCNGYDLVADIVEEVGAQGRTSKVAFTLKHLLSKINFTVLNTDTEFPMVITDLVISGVKKKGTFSSSYTQTWTPTQSNWDMSEDANDKIDIIAIKTDQQSIAVGGRVTSEYYLVLPQDLSAITFSIKATYYDGNDVVYVKEFEDQTVSIGQNSIWAPNTVYDYTISLPTAAKPIEFGSVEVSDWGDATVIELNPNDSGSNGNGNS